MTVTPVRSRKVRRILRLEARARQLLARYEQALDRATQAKGQGHALLDQAGRLELALTGTQLGELRRARGEVACEATPAEPTPPPHPPTTTATHHHCASGAPTRRPCCS